MSFQVRKILLPTDFSKASEVALDAVVGLAPRLEASVTALHVVQLPERLGPYEAWLYDHAEVEQAVIKEARALLAKLMHEKVPPTIPVDWKVLSGPPHAEIIAAAEVGHYDLIVMSTHGRSGFASFWMGSVTERVLRHAPCPVLTIRPTTEP